jgi:hypothetical protein
MAMQPHPGESAPTAPRVSRDAADNGPGLLPNGPGAAAILAAAIGSLALGVFSFAGAVWPAARSAFIIWNPSGPLSGVSTSAVGVWLAAWLLLSMMWSARNVNLVRVNLASFMMLGTGLLLTFPPFMDLLQGK